MSLIYRLIKGSPLTNAEVDANFQTVATAGIEFVIDGGGSALATGLKGYLEVPFACTLLTWKLVSPQTGSATLDIFSDPYASFGANTSMVGAGTKPSLTAANKNTSVPVGWTSVLVPAGNLIGFNLSAVSGLNQLSISLKVQKT